MDKQKKEYITFINKNCLIVRINKEKQKFKDVKIKFDIKDIEKYKNCEFDIEKEVKDESFSYYLILKHNGNVLNKEKIYLFNVKYYLTTGPFNKRIDEKPFYTYLEKNTFKLKDIYTILEREKIYKKNQEDRKNIQDIFGDNIYDINFIKIKCSGKKYFEMMKEDKEYKLDDSENIVLEIHYNKMKEKIDLIKYYNDQIEKIYNRINKDAENIGKYDLIYLYALPLVKSEGNNPSGSEYSTKVLNLDRISYRDEIKIIIDLMKEKKKKFKCLFQCASAQVLRDILETKKTKILHISSHGSYKHDNYSLILENLEKYGQEQIVEQKTLKSIVQSYASEIKNIDLVVLSTCHSGGFFDLFSKSKPKYAVYVDKTKPISDLVCVQFTKYFYSELIEGNPIKDSYDKALQKLKNDKDILSKFPDKKTEEEINKLKLFERSSLNSYLSPFAFNVKGELIVNENVKVNFNFYKYKSIIGRERIITDVFKDIKDNKKKFTIIYGKNEQDKLYFAESLSVHLFERKIIDTFEIFNESEMGENMIEFIKSKISDMQQYAKYINKKAIIIIKIESNEKLIQDILNEFSYAKNCYFIIIIDKEDIKDYKDRNKNELIRFYNAILDENGAKNLFKEICQSYGTYINDSKLNEVFAKYKQNKEYEPIMVHRIANSYINGTIDEVNEDKNNINREISLTPLYAYLFLLSKMPQGLPDCFVQLVFDKSFNDDLISKYTKNNWYYINSDIFDKIKEREKKGIKENNQVSLEQLEKYSLNYMLKALKLYFYLLDFDIERNRNNVKHPDLNFHLIFNSYNNEKIWNWKSNINYKDSINKNEFVDKDLNVQNHKENIGKLIDYLGSRIEYFDEEYLYIDYFIEILLLFPSCVFLKKVCKLYIKKCKEICSKCRTKFEDKIKHLEKDNDYQYENLKKKLENLDSILQDKEGFKENEIPKDKNFKTEIDSLNQNLKNLKANIKKSLDMYEKWKIFRVNKSREIVKKLSRQEEKLSLFLYSIISEDKENIVIPKDKDLEIEYYLIRLMKNEKDSEKYILKILEDDKKKSFLSIDKKIILYYELATNCYSNNPDKSKEYLKTALEIIEPLIEKNCNNQREKKDIKDINFYLHRINNDLCYIFLNETENIKQDPEDLDKETNDYIQKLDKIIRFHLNENIQNEERKIRYKLGRILDPNVIMLNSNPLKNKYALLSSGINANPNNQYYILEKLDELKEMKKINSFIRMKSLILNEANLEDTLKRKGEILIIQSDDYTENGDIMLENQKGISERMSKRRFKEIFTKIYEKNEDNDNKIFYKVVILGFINSSKLFEYIKDKFEYEYLIYFDCESDFKTENETIKEYNRNIVEFIINFVKLYNRKDDDIENLILQIKCGSKYHKKKINTSLRSSFRKSMIISKIKVVYKKLCFIYPLLELPTKNKLMCDDTFNHKYYQNEMLKIINEINKGNSQTFYCNKKRKGKYIKLGFDIMKFFYRRQQFQKFLCIDVEEIGKNKKCEVKSVKTEKNEKREEDQTFYLIYNCPMNDSIDSVNNILKKTKNYILIYDEEENQAKVEENDKIEIDTKSDDSKSSQSLSGKFSAFQCPSDYSESDSEDDYENNDIKEKN